MSEVASTDERAHRAADSVTLWGLVVTFRRPEELALVLRRIGQQSRVPDHMLVVDNGAEPAARQVVEAAGSDYVDAGDNLGPAGGIALGMNRILAGAGDDDWVVLFDDDDPPNRGDLIGELADFALRCVAGDPRTGAVGVVGSRYDRVRGVFRRVQDEELSGAVPVDYIGGGQFPLFSCRAIRACGGFDSSYFFGFDDAEYGLRLRRGGYSVYAHGALWRDQRTRSGRLNLDRSALVNPSNMAAWRRYYGVRNMVRIAKEYGTARAAVSVSLGGGLRGSLALARGRRPLPEVVLPVRGAVDGLLGRGGRSVDPGQAAKTA